MDNQIATLRKELRILKIILASVLIPFIVILMYGFNENQKSKIIRVKGIIVEDENGNERILIGAPLPYAKNRARTDTNKIKEKWAVGMGPQYMKWYKDYNHNCNGIMILDEKGWDKIAIGDPVPDPIIGNRIGPETGIIMNDEKGLERTGYGVLNVNGQPRVVLGLDHGNGTEGAALSVLPDGSVGLYLDSKENSIFAGHVKKDHWKSPDKKVFTGITIQDSSKKIKILKVE